LVQHKTGSNTVALEKEVARYSETSGQTKHSAGCKKLEDHPFSHIFFPSNSSSSIVVCMAYFLRFIVVCHGTSCHVY